MRLSLIPLSAALLISSIPIANAQTAYPLPPRDRDVSAREQDREPPNCGRFATVVSVHCWNYAGLASTGANLFPNTGRPGQQPGSIPLFF
ncbi:MAG TPA: hypothetical protein VKB67_10015 [Rhizomicrobium sp.]|nr:hypothetical protein [Rhizomicrobium sp.]